MNNKIVARGAALALAIGSTTAAYATTLADPNFTSSSSLACDDIANAYRSPSSDACTCCNSTSTDATNTSHIASSHAASTHAASSFEASRGEEANELPW